MSPTISSPLLYQINVRVWLNELKEESGHEVTFDDVPDKALDRLSEMKVDWVWLLSVWQTGREGQRVSRSNEVWRKEFQETLPDLREEDIAGSGFAIQDYEVDSSLGGKEALQRFRTRLHDRGIKLMLDFVPNHMALDHRWLSEHPGYFVQGSIDNLRNTPQNYFQKGDTIFAHGRDPYFDGWPDTVQLNYANPEVEEAMVSELIRISQLCDGVRCDMAMLLLPSVFEKTWGQRPTSFWPQAIKRVRAHHPGFAFMAEVYWDLEWALQQQGFDYTYDKRLYDRLREGNATAVRDHFRAGMEFQNKLARFLENHDEPRAASVFPPDMHRAAAVISFLCPGLRLFHQGQLEGKTKRISPHLIRGPKEKVNPLLQDFYRSLLNNLQSETVRSGTWKLMNCVRAWDGNVTNENFIVFQWIGEHDEWKLVVVNYSGLRSQCYVQLENPGIANHHWKLRDGFSDTTFERYGNDLLSEGLFLDEPSWKYYLFSIVRN